MTSRPDAQLAAHEHGLTCEAGSLMFQPRRLEKADLMAFASAFDPQPAHLDEVAAQETPLGGLAASGWHTCALVGNALQGAMANVSGYLGIAAIDEVRWMQPVRPGDELFGAVTLGPSAPCACGGNLQRRPARVEVRNGLGKSVLRWTCQMLFGAHRPRLPVVQCPFASVRPSKVVGRPGEHLIKFFEDVHPGDEVALGSYTFCPESVGAFECLIVPGGDDTASGASRCVSDRVKAWNVVAGWMSLIVAYYQRRASELDSANHPVPRLGPATGLRWLRWRAPVSLGERISFRSWVEHKVHAVGAGRWGLLVAGTEGYNEAGELVVSFYPQFLLERRPAAGEGP